MTGDMDRCTVCVLWGWIYHAVVAFCCAHSRANVEARRNFLFEYFL